MWTFFTSYFVLYKVQSSSKRSKHDYPQIPEDLKVEKTKELVLPNFQGEEMTIMENTCIHYSENDHLRCLCLTPFQEW